MGHKPLATNQLWEGSHLSNV